MESAKRGAAHHEGRPKHASPRRAPAWMLTAPFMVFFLIHSVAIPGIGTPEIMTIITAAATAALTESGGGRE